MPIKLKARTTYTIEENYFGGLVICDSDGNPLDEHDALCLVERLSRRYQPPASVYVAKDWKGRHKIGFSADVTRRMEQLDSELVLKLPFQSVALARMFEKLFHRLFKEQQIRGEWYGLSEADLLWFESLCGASDDEIYAAILSRDLGEIVSAPPIGLIESLEENNG